VVGFVDEAKENGGLAPAALVDGCSGQARSGRRHDETATMADEGPRADFLREGLGLLRTNDPGPLF
jgi:hypothetical protein